MSANLPVSRQSPLCYEVFSNNTLLIIDFLCQKDLLLETHKLEFARQKCYFFKICMDERAKLQSCQGKVAKSINLLGRNTIFAKYAWMDEQNCNPAKEI